MTIAPTATPIMKIQKVLASSMPENTRPATARSVSHGLSLDTAKNARNALYRTKEPEDNDAIHDHISLRMLLRDIV